MDLSDELPPEIVDEVQDKPGAEVGFASPGCRLLIPV